VAPRPLDSKRIREIARDVETILANYDRVESERDYERLFKGVIAWRQANLDTGGYRDLMRYLHDQVQYTAKNVDRQLEAFRKKLVPLFELGIRITPPSEYAYWLTQKARWKREVSDALAGLPEVGIWLDKLHKDKKRGLKPTFETPTTTNLAVDGFNMILHEYDEENPEHRRFVDVLKDGLKLYQRGAKRYFPRMLRHRLPMDVHFGVVHSSGNYGQGRIDVSRGAIKDADRFAYVVAHETGHYFGLDWMSHGARAFWIAAIKQDMAPIKLSELLAKWPPGKYFVTWMNEAESDPILGMQLRAIFDGHVKMPKVFVDADDWTREGLARYIEQHGDSALRILQTPITPYANANPDEAFAEAIALLVAYGPQAVHKQVRQWLEVVLPGEIKMASERVGKILVLDKPAIAKLRSDFLVLMKNVPRVDTYAKGAKLRDAMKVYRDNFDRVIFEHWLNRDFQYRTELSDSDRTYLEKSLRKIGWDLATELRVPLGYVNDDLTEGRLLQRFHEESPKWSNRLKTKARAFWKVMDETIDYYARTTQKSFDVEIPNEERVSMEGFDVLVVGYKFGRGQYGDDKIDDLIAKFRAGLKHFKARAGQILPVMLKAMLPIHLTAYIKSLDEGGRYHGRYIEISAFGFEEFKNLNQMAQVIAHEMGHHLFKHYLSKSDRVFWDTAILGNFGPFDIEKALSLWPGDAWAFEMTEKLKDVDPVLAVQISLLGWGHLGDGKLQKKEDFERARDSGAVLRVPQNPISGYAGKNPEEAFCEAIGQLIGYGPRTVDPLIQSWLKMIVPSIRVAHTLAVRVAARYGAEATLDEVTVLKVAARFQEKKQVPKANGKGKTTVYVYSERQVSQRNKEKAKRLQEFKPKVDKLRAKVKKDLESSDDETRLTALVVALIDETHERIGSPASSKGDLNDDGEPHYGVSQWLKKHVTLSEGKATIRYVGKSGVDQEKEVTTPYVLSALRNAVKGAEGKESKLFESVTGEKVNAYLKEFSISAKDIRGLSCNAIMQRTLRKIRSKGGKLPEEKKEREKKLKAEFKEALEEVAAEIGGHEPSTLANQYLAPGMEPAYLKDGTVIEKLSD
jgi:hypothetical protein